MKILVLHNFYTQTGGEDNVFLQEVSLLKRCGHDVFQFSMDNKSINSYPKKVSTAFKSVFNLETFKYIKSLIEKVKPEIIHVHNFFPLISPSVFFAAHRLNVPVVMTLHNYRLICPNALLFRKGRICEDCIKRIFPIKGLINKCYRDSLLQTFVVASVMSLHNLLGTWSSKVAKFITLTEFQKRKLLSSSLKVSEAKFVVKPNFTEDRGEGNIKRENFFLFVGRLSEEKGIELLIKAFSKINLPLKIVGDGPKLNLIRKIKTSNVELLGRRAKEEVITLMKQAKALVFPSLCYEGFPMVLVEAFSTGTPVIASNIGSQAELVSDGRTGFLFDIRSCEDFVKKIKLMYEYTGRELYRNAREEYLSKYTPEKNFAQLISIYQEVIDAKKAAAH